MATESKLYSKMGKFTVIPNSFVQDMKNLPPAAHSMFVILSYHINIKRDDEDVFPSYVTLKEETGLAFSTIAKGIKALMDAGWLERRKRFGGSTVYTIKYPDTITSKNGVMDDDAVLQNLVVSPPNSSCQSSKMRRVTRRTQPDELNQTNICADAQISESEIALELLGFKESENPKQPCCAAHHNGKKPSPYKEMYAAVLAATGAVVAVPSNATAVGKAARELLASGFKPNQLDDFMRWWWKNDFRGQKKQRPMPHQIGQKWGDFEASAKAQQPVQSQVQVKETIDELGNTVYSL